ncbi:MAG: hypothetical protein WKF34_03760 [Pyrinomonadaceae bacterium]
MRSKIVAGIIAGLIGGLVFGMMMQMMAAPDGKPMMAMVAGVVRSESLVVGWVYHLFNSAVIGGIFGWLFGNRIGGYGSGLLWGALYGFGWWILGGLILMPMFLGMSPFAPLMMEMMRPVAIGSLMGHILFGLVLGVSFLLLNRNRGEISTAAA